MNLLDGICDDKRVLSADLATPKNITKAQVQRCIGELLPHWDDEMRNLIVELIRQHGLHVICHSGGLPVW